MLYFIFRLYHISSLLKTIAPNLAIFFSQNSFNFVKGDCLCFFPKENVCFAESAWNPNVVFTL